MFRTDGNAITEHKVVFLLDKLKKRDHEQGARLQPLPLFRGKRRLFRVPCGKLVPTLCYFAYALNQRTNQQRRLFHGNHYTKSTPRINKLHHHTCHIVSTEHTNPDVCSLCHGKASGWSYSQSKAVRCHRSTFHRGLSIVEPFRQRYVTICGV